MVKVLTVGSKTLQLFKELLQCQTKTFCTVKMSEKLSEGFSACTQKIQSFKPRLTAELHKGQCGRIGIVGGSVEYTGAPYFAAISALKLGADLVYVFCCREAAPVIKSYSPELIVHPILDSPECVKLIEPWISRLHALVIGPGLGRDPGLLKNVGGIINLCKDKFQLPLIIDADGLHLITEVPHLIQDYSGPVILTPNAAEYSRLSAKLSSNNSLEIASTLNAVLVQKGAMDVITNGIYNKQFNFDFNYVATTCSQKGSFRRCGGQGDILSGCLATLAAWFYLHESVKFGLDPEALKDEKSKKKWFEEHIFGYTAAAYGACLISKSCSEFAFKEYGRSMTASDMITYIHKAFTVYFRD